VPDARHRGGASGQSSRRLSARPIQRHAEGSRYSVVRDFCGHGLGQAFHDAPEVVHAAKAGPGPELKPACSSPSNR
jgi:methionine aminopeptidase